MEWGDTFAKLRPSQRRTMKAWRHQPRVPDWAWWLFDAFVALQADRPVGGLGVAPISSDAVDRYIARGCYGPRASAWLRDVIPLADAIFRQRIAERTERHGTPLPSDTFSAPSRRSRGVGRK